MKTLFSFTLLILGTQFVFGQTLNTNNVNTSEVTSNSNYSRVNTFYAVQGSDPVDDMQDVKGSPFLYDDYRIGAIIKDGEIVAQDILLKYNVHKDVFQAKQNKSIGSQEVLYIFKSENYNIRMGQENFVYGKDKTYYQVIHSGAKGKLLKKHSKSFQERIQATTSLTRTVPATYKDKLAYYMVNEEGTRIEMPSSKKKVAKSFGNQQGEILKFIKENKINLSKDADLKKLFEYYETL